ncbi:MAG: transposase [Actinobacteria bacterium]|nr:transposase [Actinomycetota bacterium]MCG2683986.1 transposase [Planctomycetales bacterium]
MVKSNWQCPSEWSEWSEWLAAGLHARNQWRLPVLLTGILFARGRRTVTSWLRANGISADYADYFYFLASLGRKTESVATQLFLLLLRTLPLPNRLLAVIDDSPTKRYGPKVEGAAIHHNPTPGPADQKYLYGHIWVTLSLALRHPLWGAMALPLRAMLYVRQKTIPTIPKKRGWKFRTKLDLAAQLLEWIVTLVKKAGKTLWVVVDGGYTKAPFLKRAAAAGVVVVGRLRKDAALRTLPPALRRGQRPARGRPRKYGKNKISLAKRAGQKRGWQTAVCLVYGELVTKTFKTFLATYRPAGGLIRVVIVQEEHGWFAFFCTDPTATVVEILEAFADRATIEQDFHDIKEVWGAGQQQVRNIWTNVAVYHLNLWMHTLVELWAWRRRHGSLCDRSDSPWDDADRRPSHADRRKALRQHIMRTELSTITANWLLPRKILRLAQRLMALAT